MSAATDDRDLPAGAVDVARRYRRVERPVSGAVPLLVVAVGAAAYYRAGPVAALPAAALAVAAVRVPVLRARGTARLAADADPGTVRADFEGPAPPPLALQWGVADAVRPTDGGWAYDLSYLFGRRSVTLTVEVDTPGADAGGDDAGRNDAERTDLEVVVNAGGRPWATYAVAIHGREERTAVAVEWASDRRFGLRRLPQWVVAERYRAAALAAQGYELRERDASLSL